MNQYLSAPDMVCPSYMEFAQRYGGEILKEIGDLQIVDGDLAMTRDFDLMLGDKPFDAMRRLLEDWRQKAPHIKLFFFLAQLMVKRHEESVERLDKAQREALSGPYKPFRLTQSSEFLHMKNLCDSEQEASQAGRNVYPGCIVLMGSYALTRFRDDIGCSPDIWKISGPIFGGRSVGEILIASANGVRHQDEWFKTHPPNKQQRYSMQILSDALDKKYSSENQYYSAGRCEEVIDLLNQGCDYDGFTKTMFEYAHEIAVRCRKLSSR